MRYPPPSIRVKYKFQPYFIARGALEGTNEKSCPKCAGIMKVGYTTDRSGRYGTEVEERWYEGEPQRSFFGGLKRPSFFYPVFTYRCTRCGFLERYAPE